MSIAKKVGCKPPWDNQTPSIIPVCQTVKNIIKHIEIEEEIIASEKKIIINKTGCLVPCKYREYHVLRDPIRAPAPPLWGK